MVEMGADMECANHTEPFRRDRLFNPEIEFSHESHRVPFCRHLDPPWARSQCAGPMNGDVFLLPPYCFVLLRHSLAADEGVVLDSGVTFGQFYYWGSPQQRADGAQQSKLFGKMSGFFSRIFTR